MEKINEYKIINTDIEKWKESWDGKWDSIPDFVHSRILDSLEDNTNKAELILKKLMSK